MTPKNTEQKRDNRSQEASSLSIYERLFSVSAVSSVVISLLLTRAVSSGSRKPRTRKAQLVADSVHGKPQHACDFFIATPGEIVQLPMAAETRTVQENLRPEATLAGHLGFALKHEGVHLEALSRLFEVGIA